MIADGRTLSKSFTKVLAFPLSHIHRYTQLSKHCFTHYTELQEKTKLEHVLGILTLMDGQQTGNIIHKNITLATLETLKGCHPAKELLPMVNL